MTGIKKFKKFLEQRSIAVRLAVSSIFWSFIILLVAGVILAKLYRQASEKAYDIRLLMYVSELASNLAYPSEANKTSIEAKIDPRFERPLSGWYWQIIRKEDPFASDKRLSPSLFGSSLPLLDMSGNDPVRKGYGAAPDERLLRLVERDIDLGDGGRFVVSIGAPADEIEQEVTNFLWALIVTGFALISALGLSTLFQIRFGLSPLVRLTSAVTAVRAGQETQIRGDYPWDIAPLAQELNLLITANHAILERSRMQVGNLAHALKTPLNVLMNEAKGHDSLSHLVQEQSALMRVQVDHYLKRARSAALVGTLRPAIVVSPVLEALQRTFLKIYQDKQIRIILDLEDRLSFRGEQQDLEEMLGNLIDNSCKWATSEVLIHANLHIKEDRSFLCLTVEDDGEGLSADDLKTLPKRGQRLDESVPGSGLGLSIVVELAELYGGSLQLKKSSLNGLCATLWLPGLKY